MINYTVPIKNELIKLHIYVTLREGRRLLVLALLTDRFKDKDVIRIKLIAYIHVAGSCSCTPEVDSTE